MAQFGGVIFSFLFSQTAWIILWTVSKWSMIFDPVVILSVGIFFISLILYLMFAMMPVPKAKFFKENKFVQFVYYGFAFCTWTSMVDLVLYFEACGTVKGIMDFYLELGEPYLGSSWGKAANLWDATVHYFLYLSLVFFIQNNKLKLFYNFVLYWIGTMTMGMICLVFATFCGTWGSSVHLAIFLNIPFFVVPFMCLDYFLYNHEKFETQRATSSPREKQQNPITTCILLLSIVCCILFNSVRLLAALDSPFWLVKQYATIEPYIQSPENYGLFVILMNFFYGIPFLVTAFKFVWSDISSSVFNNVSLLYAGAISQATFIQLYPQFNRETTDEEYLLTKEHYIPVICLNLMLPAVAFLLIYHRQNSYCNKKSK